MFAEWNSIFRKTMRAEMAGVCTQPHVAGVNHFSACMTNRKHRMAGIE
jgi:hypothetical protein